MYIHCTFKDGSNPYIATTNAAFWFMINRYSVEQTGDCFFTVNSELQLLTVKHGKMSARDRAKAVLRDFAIQWQYDFANFNYSCGELLDWQSFFSEYGRKYGLIREFRENCIPC